MASTYFLRRLDVATPSQFKGKPVSVIGAGGIRAATVVALAKTGFENLTVYTSTRWRSTICLTSCSLCRWGIRPPFSVLVARSGRAGTVFELMDALAGDPQARTPVELSLSPLFQRQYPSIYDGLDGWLYDELAVKGWLLDVASTLGGEDFRLIGVDHAPKPRPHARKVVDRSFAHQPNFTWALCPCSSPVLYS